MKLEKLSCNAWIDEQGIVHPTAQMARQYHNWKPGHFALGDNYREKIQDLIDEHLDQKMIEYCVDKKTGELLPAKLAEFKKIAPMAEKQAIGRLLEYEHHCTQLRKKHGMNPFMWQLETIDRIRDQFKPKPKKPRMRNPDNYLFWANTENQPIWPGFPKSAAKPEHQDENHPLEIKQAKRTANPVGQSNQAQNALELYDKTGELDVPEQDRVAWEHDRLEWEKHIPNCKKPIVQAEGLDYIIHDVAKKLKTRLLDIEKGKWTEIRPRKTPKKG